MKKALITGGSRGIGKATAEKFLAEGWSVAATSTSGTGWAHENLTWTPLDLSNPESIIAAADALAAYGPFDALVDNGAIGGEEEDADGIIRYEVLRKTLEANLIGTIDFTERMLPCVARGGQIILLGSRLGSIAEAKSSFAPSYSISKAGLSMYCRRLAARLEPDGMTVSIVNPGWVKTDMGGPEAPRSPQEPAQEIYTLATSPHPSGRFWFQGKEFPW